MDAERLFVAFLIVSNVVVSLGIIFVNKHLFARLGFAHSGSLTALHFAATTAFCSLLVVARTQPVSTLDRRSVIILAGITAIGVWSQNLSLLYNTVSVYQVAKLCVVPITVALQFVALGKGVTARTTLALALVTAGVGTITLSDGIVGGSLSGLLLAFNGAVTTAVQQLVSTLLCPFFFFCFILWLALILSSHCPIPMSTTPFFFRC